VYDDGDDVAALAEPAATAWLPAAARLMAGLGFSLVNSSRPAAPGGSHLLVALRDRPTLRHFDPELVRVWVSRAGRGRPLEITRASTRPADLEVEWGHVHVVDRLGVENRFLGFGGRLRLADADPTTMIAALASPGPIVRWGGHSQGTDPLATALGAFFGRLIIPVDFQPGAERELAETDPAALYAAFLRFETARRRGAPLLRDAAPSLDAWLTHEAARLATDRPAAWAAGEGLLANLGLAG
jgi:hypothetical protein